MHNDIRLRRRGDRAREIDELRGQRVLTGAALELTKRFLYGGDTVEDGYSSSEVDIAVWREDSRQLGIPPGINEDWEEIDGLTDLDEVRGARGRGRGRRVSDQAGNRRDQQRQDETKG